MQDADAQDLAQQILLSISQSIVRWEKRNESIRFRHWLRRVARNAIINALSRQPKDKAIGGSAVHSAFDNHSEDEEQFDREIELEHRREIFYSATQLLKSEVSDEVWKIFQLSCLEDLPIQDVANSLGKTVGATYAARGRVVNRMRKIVEQLERQDC